MGRRTTLDNWLRTGRARRQPPIGDEAEPYQFGHRIEIYQKEPHRPAEDYFWRWLAACECGWSREFQRLTELKETILAHQDEYLRDEGVPL